MSVVLELVSSPRSSCPLRCDLDQSAAPAHRAPITGAVPCDAVASEPHLTVTSFIYSDKRSSRMATDRAATRGIVPQDSAGRTTYRCARHRRQAGLRWLRTISRRHREALARRLSAFCCDGGPTNCQVADDDHASFPSAISTTRLPEDSANRRGREAARRLAASRDGTRSRRGSGRGDDFRPAFEPTSRRATGRPRSPAAPSLDCCREP